LKACKNLLEGSGKDKRPGDEVGVLDKQTIEKLDILATGKLSELSKFVSPEEKTAAAKLLST
jgi:hypothetical protein